MSKAAFKSFLMLTAVMCVAGVTQAVAEETTVIKGRIVFDGDVPEPKLIIKEGDQTVKDPEVCAVQNKYDQTLIVDPETKGVANCVIYLRGDDLTPDDYEVPDEVVFDQKDCVFIPHILPVVTSQKVIVKSDDSCSHNTHTIALRNDNVNFAIAANNREGVPVEMPVEELLPFPVTCDIHPHMKAHWVVSDNPFTAVTSADGSFEIKGVPAGKEIKIRVWHERPGYIKTRGNAKKGRAKTSVRVTLEPGEVYDFGEVMVEADEFEE